MDVNKKELTELDPVEEMLVDRLAGQAEEPQSDNAVAAEDTDAAVSEKDAETDGAAETAAAEKTSEEELSGDDDFFKAVGDTIEETVETGELPGEKKPKKTPFFLSGAFLNDAIRILSGLILLVFSRMSFIPEPANLILALAAAVLCGLPLAFRAIEDFRNKSYLNENVFVLAAGVLCVFCGGAVDGVIALVVADVGFRLRDTALDWYRTEADRLIGDNSSDSERGIVEPMFRMIEVFFTPAVALLAVISALLSLILSGDALMQRLCCSLAVLSAGAPLMIAAVTSLTYDIGKGSALKKGIRFKDVQSINAAAKLTSIIFNKTGTVTTGKYYISGIYPVKISSDQLISLAAYAEIYSNHPLATAIKERFGKELDPRKVVQQREEKGSGSFVQLSTGAIVAVGNIELMEKLGVNGDLIPSDCVSVYVAVGKTFVGRLDFEYEVKPEAAETVSRIRKTGVANVALMTGDNTLSATRLARGINISEVYADCTPHDKYERVRYIVSQKEADDRLGYVVAEESEIRALELADLKIVLGAEAKNLPGTVTIPSRDLAAIPALISDAKRISGMVRVNTIAILAVKAISIILALFGIFGVTCVVLLDICCAVLTAFAAMFVLGK